MLEATQAQARIRRKVEAEAELKLRLRLGLGLLCSKGKQEAMIVVKQPGGGWGFL
jgi:hypothetical protein